MAVHCLWASLMTQETLLLEVVGVLGGAARWMGWCPIWMRLALSLGRKKDGMWVEMEVETKEGDDGLKWGRRGLVLIGTMDDLSKISIYRIMAFLLSNYGFESYLQSVIVLAVFPLCSNPTTFSPPLVIVTNAIPDGNT
ncbi:hypothetical protein BJ165DRAFT_1568367 [Panaeolus papilionaceus]|nr:hypothetical protein BJ165DRAFT_1568367 [Panaeolus papilionaceus]